MEFRKYLLLESAKGLKDLQFSGPNQNIPNFQIQIAEQGMFIRIYVGSKFSGDLSANECFNDTKLLPPYKLFAWHSDINKSRADGFGPFLYDIAMEIATIKGGYLVSHALVNRLMKMHLSDDGKLNKDYHKLKGGIGGDPSDEAENVYQFYYFKRQEDVESIVPNIIFANPETKEILPDQNQKPYLYELYRKQPKTINSLIELNKQGKIVLLDGLRNPILNLNF